jgi:hypothetical protein
VLLQEREPLRVQELLRVRVLLLREQERERIRERG